MKKLLLLLLSAASVLAAAELKIAENGKACAGILIPAKAKPTVRAAAAELALYLQKITGAKFTVGTKSSFKTNFRLGMGNPAGLADEEFVIRTSGNNIDIYGHDSNRAMDWIAVSLYENKKSTLSGVYYFLETLGVRWPLPDLEHVPQQKTLVLKDLNIRFKPFFSYRQSASWGYNFAGRHPDWKEYSPNNREFCKWRVRIGESASTTVVGCHTERALGMDLDPAWTAVPERLMLGKNGKRNKRYSCWTHPDVLALWQRAADGYFSGKTAFQCGIKYHRGHKKLRWPWPYFWKNEFMIDPMDNDGVNDGRCYCKRCQDFRKKHPCPDDSEIMWRVIGKVAADVYKKHPGKYITTLVYPPKRQLPKIKLTPNVRVKICLGGPKMVLSPEAFKAEMRSIADWYKLTANKVPLWTYHCITFNNSQPHMVEYYPHLLQKYMQGMKKHSNGMFMETHSANYTRKLSVVYLFNRLMRNPDLDLEKELDEYYRITYGPAHKEARLFWDGFENSFREFWNKTVKPTSRPGLVTPWGYRNTKNQMLLWKLGYTEAFIKQQGKLLAAMEKKTAGTRYAKHVARIRKYIYDDLATERNNVVNKEKVRATLAVEIPRIKGKMPSGAEWAKAPVFKLAPARKFIKKLEFDGSCKVLASKEHIFIRAEIFDPLMKKGLTKKQSGQIWRRNAFEVFFYAPKGDLRWQIIYYDWGVRACSKRIGNKVRWIVLPGMRSGITKRDGKWMIDGIYPIKELLPQGGELRFNITRERRIGNKAEFSSWSPLAGERGWHDVRNYPTVILK